MHGGLTDVAFWYAGTNTTGHVIDGDLMSFGPHITDCYGSRLTGLIMDASAWRLKDNYWVDNYCGVGSCIGMGRSHGGSIRGDTFIRNYNPLIRFQKPLFLRASEYALSGFMVRIIRLVRSVAVLPS